MRKHIVVLLAISLVVMSPGIGAYRAFAAGPVSGAATAPGAGWAGAMGKLGAGMQAPLTSRYGAESPLVEFSKLDFSSKHGQFMAQPLFDQLESQGRTVAAFEAASQGQRQEWLSAAFNGAADSEGAKFDAAFKTRIDSATDDQLKAMNGELDRLSARGFLYLDPETHEQAIMKHDAVYKALVARVKSKIDRTTRDWKNGGAPNGAASGNYGRKAMPALTAPQARPELPKRDNGNGAAAVLKESKTEAAKPSLMQVLVEKLRSGLNLIGNDNRRDPRQGGRDSVIPESLPAVMPNPDDATRLSDVAGQDEAKEEFLKILDWLKNPAAYAKVGAKGYKGVLEYGPPGTGKTLMARAIANELQIPFLYKAGSEFEQELVGVGAKRIRELKDQAIQAAMELEARDQEEARKNRQPAPKKTYGAVIFIDEIETFGKKRGSGHGEQAQTLNQLLTEMDGFVQDLKHPILWIAATNMPETLDPALTRGGRFELQIPIGLPDVVGREAVFKVHTKKKPLAEDVDLKVLAKHTAGLAPADIEAIVNDAAMTVGRERREKLTMKDLESSIDRFGPAGAARPRMMDPEQKAVIAAHEAGHALITLLVPNGAPLRKLTIVAHGLQALGFSQQVEENEKFVKSKKWYEDQIAIALGGRAGELMATGEIFSGASNDFEKATYYANLMVTKFGMSERAGTVIFDTDGDQSKTGHKAGRMMEEVINEEVKGIIKAQTERVRKLLEDNKETWEKMRKDLMEKETLYQEDFEAYKAAGPKKA